MFFPTVEHWIGEFKVFSKLNKLKADGQGTTRLELSNSLPDMTTCEGPSHCTHLHAFMPCE